MPKHCLTQNHSSLEDKHECLWLVLWYHSPPWSHYLLQNFTQGKFLFVTKLECNWCARTCKICVVAISQCRMQQTTKLHTQKQSFLLTEYEPEVPTSLYKVIKLKFINFSQYMCSVGNVGNRGSSTGYGLKGRYTLETVLTLRSIHSKGK